MTEQGKRARAVVVLSGGMDSTTALYHTRATGAECIALTIDYGQRHHREIGSARLITERLGIEHVVVPGREAMQPLMQGSALTSAGVDVPEGHYAEDSMKATVVPNRNMVLLSLAGAFAISRGATFVVYGPHAGDHAIYPDCRPQFVEAMREAYRLCDWHILKLETPFLRKTKADVVAAGTRLGVPYELTWSCYKGGDKHCGKCGTCVERAEAFTLAGVPDPTAYEVER